MKITALLVMKVSPAPASSTVLLANASDVSQFGFFQRQSAKEFIVFASRTIAGRTPLGQRQSVEQDGMLVYLAWILGIFSWKYYTVVSEHVKYSRMWFRIISFRICMNFFHEQNTSCIAITATDCAG